MIKRNLGVFNLRTTLLLMKTLEKRFLPMSWLIALMNFFPRNNELGYSLEYRLTRFCQKNAFSDEIVVHYEGPKEEPVPPVIDLGDFSPAKFF